MPDPVPACASIIPLDYGNHLEFSIMLVDQWNQLAPLLADPVNYMAGRPMGRQFNWNQTAPPIPAPVPAGGNFPLPRPPGVAYPRAQGPIPWLLQAPLMAEIRPLTDRPDLGPIVLGLTGNPPIGALDLKVSPTWQAQLFSMWKTDFPGGFFIAEFAANTALLQISYLPPWIFQGQTYHREIPPRAFGTAAGKPTFVSMTITEPTIWYLTLPAATNLSAVIHQDLLAPAGQPAPTQTDRANLIVDLLGSRDWYVAWLNNSPSYKTSYSLEQIPGPINIRQPVSVAAHCINPQIGIAYPFGSPQPAPQSDLPRFSAQLGDTGPMDACYITQVLDAGFLAQRVNPPAPKTVLGDGATKIYAPLPPPVG